MDVRVQGRDGGTGAPALAIAGVSTHAAAGARRRGTGERIRVLLVEDNPGDARLVREYLGPPASSAFAITWSDQLGSALDRLESEPFDALLLDLSLPDSAASETLSRTRARASEVPTVVFTGLDDEEAGLDAVRHGAQDFLVKGRVDSETLSRSIRYAITRKRLEAALTERTAQLEAAVRLKDLFTDIMRHDLVDVLNIVKVALDVVAGPDADAEQRRRMLLLARRNVDRLNEIISTASLYSKLETTEGFDRQTLDLGDLLRKAIDTLRPALDEKGMQLDCRATGPYPARVNPLLENVFANLLSNAIKYSPPRRRIEMDIVDHGDRYTATVKDWGEGIAEEDKTKVFTRFQRVHKKGVKGTGLGLAITKRIVDLHGGRVWIDDNPEGGAVFSVELPKTA